MVSMTSLDLVHATHVGYSSTRIASCKRKFQLQLKLLARSYDLVCSVMAASLGSWQAMLTSHCSGHWAVLRRHSYSNTVCLSIGNVVPPPHPVTDNFGTLDQIVFGRAGKALTALHDKEGI